MEGKYVPWSNQAQKGADQASAQDGNPQWMFCWGWQGLGT